MPTSYPSSWAINQAVPGLSRLTSTASGVIQNALSGLPSPSLSRLSNAYFEAGSGLDPTSELLRNRGFDLYRTQAQGQQRQGIQDLATLLGATAGTVAPTPGQELQDRQSQGQLALGKSQLKQSGDQFQQNFGFEREQYEKQLELLNKYLGGGGGPAAGTGGMRNLAAGSAYTNFYSPTMAEPGSNPWASGARFNVDLGQRRFG